MVSKNVNKNILNLRNASHMFQWLLIVSYGSKKELVVIETKLWKKLINPISKLTKYFKVSRNRISNIVAMKE